MNQSSIASIGRVVGPMGTGEPPESDLGETRAVGGTPQYRVQLPEYAYITPIAQ